MADSRFVFAVDLDGVVADFYGGIRRIATDWLGVPEADLPTEVTHGLSEWNIDDYGGYEALHRFAVTQRELFKSLTPIPGAPQVLRRLSTKGVRIRIVTHRLYIKYFHRQAIRQTVDWLDQYDVPYWDLCFMKEKAAVGADLYIDDAPANVTALRAEGLKAIVFTNSTNRGLAGPRADSWDEVEEIALAEMAAWRRPTTR